MARRQPHARLGRSQASAIGVALLMAHLLLPLHAAHAQFSTAPVELSGAVTFDEVDSAVRGHLERVKAYIAESQWDEAVETLRQVMETHGDKMIPLAAGRYVNLADFCHAQIASLPPDALTLYRQRVDPLAQKWYDEGLARRNADRLAEVADKLFCSSWGDRALMALGEIELERGHHGAARRYWERLVEVPPAQVSLANFETVRQQPGLAAEDAALLDEWYARELVTPPKYYQLKANQILTDTASAALVRLWRAARLPTSRLAFPGTTIPLADVRARLVLVSIMEGSLRRAREELASLERLHPGAEGRLGGRQVKFAEALAALVDAAEQWPAQTTAADWPTFAGAYGRTKVASRNLDLGALAWEPIRLGEPTSADLNNSRAFSLRRVAEDAQRLLSYHPIIVDNLLLVNNQHQIFAFDLRTGGPAWASDDPKRPMGEIFNGENGSPSASRMQRGLGVPRFTMTAHNGKLFARMGSQVTSRPLESLDGRSGGYLVCLDLKSQGRVVWTLPEPGRKALIEDEKWAFEGSPVVGGANVYVAMRKSDVRPQAHVACFDVETGSRRWRTMICSAETPGGGQSDEITNNLLTLEQDTLYYNTNLGAVAAISARDGRLQWASTYPRARKAGPDGQDRRTAHFYRDLNPCVYYRGMLMVAPTDCESIFALDAGSGELLWESHLPEDTVHLLGVGHGNLLASGDTLWWIDAERGKVIKHWPDTTPLGYGRGVLSGDQVLWPTRGELFVFDQAVAPGAKDERDPISLAGNRGAMGGNLVAAGDWLLIAGSDKLYAFRQQGQAPGATSERSRPPVKMPIKEGP